MKSATFASGLAAVAAILMASVTSQSAQAMSPSFDCATVRKASERAICMDRRLSRLDRRLDYWYGRAMERASYFDHSRYLRAEQREWLDLRDSCGQSRRCLRFEYRTRIRRLRRYATHV